MSRRIHVHNRAAIEAAQRARRQRTATILRAPVVVRSGPAFALIVPVQFVVETHPPDSGPHVQPKTGDAVEGATSIVLMVAVIFFLVGRVVMRLVNAAGEVFSFPDPED